MLFPCHVFGAGGHGESREVLPLPPRSFTRARVLQALGRAAVRQQEHTGALDLLRERAAADLALPRCLAHPVPIPALLQQARHGPLRRFLVWARVALNCVLLGSTFFLESDVFAMPFLFFNAFSWWLLYRAATTSPGLITRTPEREVGWIAP